MEFVFDEDAARIWLSTRGSDLASIIGGPIDEDWDPRLFDHNTDDLMVIVEEAAQPGVDVITTDVKGLALTFHSLDDHDRGTTFVQVEVPLPHGDPLDVGLRLTSRFREPAAIGSTDVTGVDGAIVALHEIIAQGNALLRQYQEHLAAAAH